MNEKKERMCRRVTIFEIISSRLGPNSLSEGINWHELTEEGLGRKGVVNGVSQNNEHKT